MSNSKQTFDNAIFEKMSHEQIMNVIKEGLHYLTTIDLVTLHSEISKVQIEHSHLREDPCGQ
jgi:hypothetical protein